MSRADRERFPSDVSDEEQFYEDRTIDLNKLTDEVAFLMNRYKNGLRKEREKKTKKRMTEAAH